jgi:Tfp pilus assembly protein PilX
MQSLNNQNGFAIVTVLMVLALITLAGVMVSKTTTTELQIATRDQLHKIAFYAAEAAQSYVILNSDLYGSANIDTTDPVNFPDDANPSATQTLDADSIQSFNGEVGYENLMVVPRGSGFQVGKFKAHVYQMVCTGYGPRNSDTRIEVGFYRIGF